MKIDFKKIINIKNNKNLTHFKLDEPIFLNNYLFHYLILLNNLKGLKLYKFPVYIENNNYLNGFHLAAKEYNYNILCYLIKTYPDYIYNKNKYNYTFINYLPIKKINKLILKFPKLNWKQLIEPENKDLIRFIFTNLSYKDLKKFIILYNYKPTNICPYMFAIVLSNILTIDEKISLLDLISDEDLNIKYSDNSGILLYVNDYYNNEKLIKYLINRNVDIDNCDFKGNNLLPFIIRHDILNDKNELSLYILNIYMKKSDNFIEINDIYMDNLLHYIFYIRIFNNDIKFNNYKIDEFVISLANNEHLNKNNVDFETPLELICLLDYNIYSKLLLKLKNISISKKTLDKIKNKDSLFIKEWIKLFNTFVIYNEENNAIINNYNNINYSIYGSSSIDICIFMIYLKNKYDFLYVPTIKNHILNNLSFNQNINIYYHDYKYMLYPWIINIASLTEYYIHPYLNNLINSAKNNKKYNYSIVYLSIINKNEIFNHANILIYNFEKLTIERFEPYGFICDYNIDEILEEILTWNTGFKYISPKVSQPFLSFQILSNENMITNKKYGDPGGFCLAWCIWYLETKFLNKNINSKILINKLIKKITNLNIRLVDHIRNYANQLINEKYEYLKKINFNSKNIYNVKYTINEYKIIMNHIIKYFDS